MTRNSHCCHIIQKSGEIFSPDYFTLTEKLKDPEDPEGNPEKKKEREEKGGKGECVKGKGKGE